MEMLMFARVDNFGESILGKAWYMVIEMKWLELEEPCGPKKYVFYTVDVLVVHVQLQGTETPNTTGLNTKKIY